MMLQRRLINCKIVGCEVRVHDFNVKYILMILLVIYIYIYVLVKIGNYNNINYSI